MSDDWAGDAAGNSMEEYNPLTTNGGTRIDWKTVVAVASGIFSTAFFSGLADFIRGLFEVFLIKPLTAIAEFVNLLLTGLFLAAPATIRGSFQAAANWLEGLGPLAFIGAVVIVVATAWAVARGLDRDA